MKRNAGFVYNYNGYMYFLEAQMRWGKSRCWLVGAEMYDKDDTYRGFWPRYNMPVSLIRELTAFAKKTQARPTATRQLTFIVPEHRKKR